MPRAALFSLLLLTAAVAVAEAVPVAPSSDYTLPQRDPRQSEYDDVERRVKLLRLEAEEAELRQRIAKATGDNSGPTNSGVPLLTAILITDGGKMAYFRDGKRTLKARKGDRVGGAWVLRAFLGNAVRLEHSDTGSTYVASIGAKAPEASAVNTHVETP